jgi:G3E family GTPase
LFKRTQRSAVDLSNIFGIGGYSAGTSDTGGRTEKTRLPASLQAIRQQQEDGNGEGHDHDHNHDHDRSSKKHLNGISSYVFELPVLSESQLQGVESFLQSLHWENRIEGIPQDGPAKSAEDKLVVLRSKGLFITDEGKVHILQGVRDIYELNELGATADELEDNERGSKLVVIGRNLGDRSKWLEGLRATCNL